MALRKKAAGRPKSKDRATAHYNVNVTPGQQDLIDRAAMQEDGERFPSRWVRKVALREARRVLGVDVVGKAGR